eukprot:g16200.t1
MTRLNDLEERLRRMEDKSVSDQEQIRRLTETIRRLEQKTSGGGATSSSAAERDRQLETTRKNVRDLQDRMYAMERAQKQASKDDSAAGSSSSSLTAKLQKLVREEVEEKLRGTTSTGSGSHEDGINPQDLHEEISHMHRLLLPTVFQHLKVSMKVIRKLCDERWLTEVNGADKDDFALLTGLLQSHERDDVLKETETFFGMEVVEEEAAGAGNRGGESRAGSSVGEVDEDEQGGAEKATAGRAGAIAVEGKGGEGQDSGTRGAADAGAGAAAGAEVNTPGDKKEATTTSRIRIRTAEEIRRAEDDAPVEIRNEAQQVEAAEGNKSGEGTADGAGSDAGVKPDPTLKDDMIEAWKGRDLRESRNCEAKAGGERPRLLIIGAHLPGNPDRATIRLPLRHLVAIRTISLITSVIVIICRGAARKLLLRGTIHRPTGEGALTTPKRKNKHRW